MEQRPLPPRINALPGIADLLIGPVGLELISDCPRITDLPMGALLSALPPTCFGRRPQPPNKSSANPTIAACVLLACSGSANGDDDEERKTERRQRASNLQFRFSSFRCSKRVSIKTRCFSAQPAENNQSRAATSDNFCSDSIRIAVPPVPSEAEGSESAAADEPRGARFAATDVYLRAQSLCAGLERIRSTRRSRGSQ